MILAFNKANEYGLHVLDKMSEENNGFDAKVYQIVEEETSTLIKVNFWQNFKTNIAYNGSGDYVYFTNGCSFYGYENLKHYADEKDVLNHIKEIYGNESFSYMEMAQGIISYFEKMGFKVGEFYKWYVGFYHCGINLQIEDLVKWKKHWVDENDTEEGDNVSQYENGLYYVYDSYSESSYMTDEVDADFFDNLVEEN